MNLRTFLAGAGLAALALAATTASAQSAPSQTATANASATIVTPASMSSTQDLAFGTIAKPTTTANQSVTVAAVTGNQTPTLGTGNGYVASSGQAHAAIFHLAGTAGTTCGINQSSSTLTFGATADASLSPTLVFPTNVSSCLLSNSGTADVPIGATIQISSSTTATTYSGTLTLVANFQ